MKDSWRKQGSERKLLCEKSSWRELAGLRRLVKIVARAVF